MKLRIQFSKHGAMKFIGHLDTMRFFQKAFRRSGIDISYSTGFSPHQIMAFAAPLGVGLESESEYLDIEAGSVTSTEDMVTKLNNAMSEGFKIIDIRLLPDNAGNAMASVQGASYSVAFREDRRPTFDLHDAIDLFNKREEVVVTKQTKKSEIELDIKPSVYELTTDGLTVYMKVDASSAGNIKPDLVMNAIYSFYNEAIPANALMITRLETYGRDNDGNLIPLIDFGTKI